VLHYYYLLYFCPPRALLGWNPTESSPPLADDAPETEKGHDDSTLEEPKEQPYGFGILQLHLAGSTLGE
jgi:hypothetical protein